MSQLEETVEVQIAPITYVQVMMPGGVVQVFERPIHVDVASVGPQGGPGPPGMDGADGPPGQNAIIGTWEGVWSVGVTYAPLSLVQHQGSTYLNPGPSSVLNVQPPALPWELVASKGSDLAPFEYVHNQLIASAVWTVVHGLNGYPNVTAIDSANSEIVGDLLYIDNNTVQITFASGTTGKAYVS